MEASQKRPSRFWPFRVISLKACLFIVNYSRHQDSQGRFLLIFSSIVGVTVQTPGINELLQSLYCSEVTVLAK